MNINLIYEGKNYNFDIPNNVTIDYLKELSSKIFNSEKELLDIIYNNKKISENSNNTLIRDLIPEGESNIILTVQINKNLNKRILKSKKEKKSFELTKKKNNSGEINIGNMNNRYEQKKEKSGDKINQKDVDNNKNENNKYNNNNMQSKIRLMLNNNIKLNFKEISKKEKFINAYIQKSGDLFSLIRKFSDKIKNIFIILYNKYKISKKNKSNNTSIMSKATKIENENYNTMNSSFYELVLYEKKIMNFLENQIQYYKNLIETLQNYDTNDINYSKLTDLYNKLFLFSSEKNGNNIKKIKKVINRNKSLIINNSLTNLTSFKSYNNNNKLPSIKIKNLKSPFIKETRKDQFLSEFKINNINNNNKKELKENKFQKNININNTNKKNKNNSEEDNISSNNNSKKINILDNISEKNSFESNNTEKNNNLKNIKNVRPLSPNRLNKKISAKIISDKNDIDNNINSFSPIKEKKLNQQKNSILISPKHKSSMDKKVYIESDMMQTNKSKKIKEINISSLTIKDSNFSLEKNFAQNKKNAINKYDYVM